MTHGILNERAVVDMEDLTTQMADIPKFFRNFALEIVSLIKRFGWLLNKIATMLGASWRSSIYNEFMMRCHPPLLSADPEEGWWI